MCLSVDSSTRATLEQLCADRFLASRIDKENARRTWKSKNQCRKQTLLLLLFFVKQNYLDCNVPSTEWKTSRSLFNEMFSVHNASTDMKEEFLLRALKAIKLAEKQFHGIVDKVPDAQLIKDYVAVEALLMVQQEDEDWSRDVLDVSSASLQDTMEHRPRRRSFTPGRARTSALPADRFGKIQNTKPEELEASFLSINFC